MEGCSLCLVSCSCCDHGCCGGGNATHALHEVEADALSNKDGARTALDAAELLTLLNPVAICAAGHIAQQMSGKANRHGRGW